MLDSGDLSSLHPPQAEFQIIAITSRKWPIANPNGSPFVEYLLIDLDHETYDLQSDRLRQRELDKIDSVWMRMLRAMVRGGLEREPNKYSYSIGRARILTLCNTREASTFVRKQHIKYVAHVCRMENSALQKQMLFTPQRKGVVCQWKRLAGDYNIEPGQLRRACFDKKQLDGLLQAAHGRTLQ